jgi:hypothetical protein
MSNREWRGFLDKVNRLIIRSAYDAAPCKKESPAHWPGSAILYARVRTCSSKRRERYPPCS